MTDATMTADIVAPIRVLIADDEVHLGTILEQYLSARGCAVTVVRDGREALERLLAERFDVALLDVVMPELDGLEVLRRMREQMSPPEMIVVTGNGTIETTISALKLGAYDCVSKPYRMAEVEALVRRAFEKRMLLRNNQLLNAQQRRDHASAQILTQFAPLLAVRALLERVAPSTSCVLISGEVGTGKRNVARFIHAHSHRADGPMLTLDCAGDDAHVVHQRLFGTSDEIGMLEMADGGTLYLDNVERLALPAQEALSRAIDRGSFVRGGDAQRVHASVRVIAATADDFSRAVSSGRVSADFAHRLGTIRVTLPPLRERTTDIALLAEHFLAAVAGARKLHLTTDARAALERYRWPGNVRELKHVIERAAMLARDQSVGTDALALDAHDDVSSRLTSRLLAPPTLTLAELERRHIAEVLERTQWHQGRASELLGISPKTLYRKIREFGFTRPSGRE